MADLLECEDQEANRTDDGAASRWQARPPLVAFPVVALPWLIFVIIFWTIFALIASRAGNYSGTIFAWPFALRLGSTAAAWLFWANAFVVAAATLLAFAVPFWRFALTRYALAGSELTIGQGRRTRRFELHDLPSLVLTNALWWRAVSFRSGGRSFRLLLGEEDARMLAASLNEQGLATRLLHPFDVSLAGVDRDEPVLWRGRPGWRSLDRMRQIQLALIGSPFLFFGLAALWAHAASRDLVSLLFAYLPALALFGFPAIGVLLIKGRDVAGWVRDMVGTVLVTDRRVAWIAAVSGRLYRDLPLANIVEAQIVEGGSRGWVSLTVRNLRDQIESVDLHGVPMPEDFAAAVSAGLAGVQR